SRETEQAACELVGGRDDELRQHERPRLRPGRTQPSFCSTERPEETRRAAAADQCPQPGGFVEAAGGVGDLVRQDERTLGVRVVEQNLELELECVEVCLALAGCEGPTPSSDVGGELASARILGPRREQPRRLEHVELQKERGGVVVTRSRTCRERTRFGFLTELTRRPRGPAKGRP